MAFWSFEYAANGTHRLLLRNVVFYAFVLVLVHDRGHNHDHGHGRDIQTAVRSSGDEKSARARHDSAIEDDVVVDD